MTGQKTVIASSAIAYCIIGAQAGRLGEALLAHTTPYAEASLTLMAIAMAVMFGRVAPDDLTYYPWRMTPGITLFVAAIIIQVWGSALPGREFWIAVYIVLWLATMKWLAVFTYIGRRWPVATA